MSDREIVVVTHGLWVNGYAMGLLRSRLAHLGHRVRNFSYHSVNVSLSENAARLSEFVQTLDAERVHFVGHSLGGVLVAQMLHERDEPRYARVVLAGSPYQGSHVGEELTRFKLGQHMLGKSVRQWLRQAKPDVSQHHELGVICGTRSIGLGRIVPGLPVPNDGTIAVEETKVPGAKDRLILHVSHSEMLISAQVARQIDRFLRTGRFMHEARAP